jgi:hypothetical protein
VIMQVWISTHLGVLSEQLPSQMKTVISSGARLPVTRPGVKAIQSLRFPSRMAAGTEATAQPLQGGSGIKSPLNCL